MVDANIIIHHLNNTSAECTFFFERVSRLEVEGYLTTTILAEVLHRTMLQEAFSKGFAPSTKTLNHLKAKPSIITHLTNYIAQVNDLMLLPLTIIEVVMSDITASHALRNAHGLFTNDSINLACAQRFGINDIISHDTDFARVPTINLWSPSDI